MATVIIRVQQETREKLRKLAAMDRKSSMMRTISILVDREYARIFAPELAQEKLEATNEIQNY